MFTTTTLHTKRCTLRPWHPEDGKRLPVIANTRDISWNTSYKFPHPFGPTEAERFLDFHMKDLGTNSWQFAILFEDLLIGGCGALRGQDVQSHTAEIGYWLNPGHWGKGLATEVVRGFVRFMDEDTDIEQLTATCFAWNKPSAHVLEKNGFILEGTRKGVIKKWGKYTDLWIYGKLLHPA